MNSKAAFFCDTQHQLFNAIVLKTQLDMDADIFFYSDWIECKGFKNRLEKEGIFSNVFLIDQKYAWKRTENKTLNYFSALIGYMRINKVIKRGVPNIDDYSDIFLIANERIYDRYLYCYEKCFGKAKVHYYEDGTGSYDNACYKISRFDKLARKIFLGNNSLNQEYDLYLYSQDLYNGINRDSNRLVVEVNPLSIEYKNIISRIFQINDTTRIDYDSVIFDTVWDELSFKDDGKKYKSLIDKYIDCNNNVIVKSHPRDMIKHFNCDYLDEQNIPFEILCLYNQYNDNIFITYYSTAVFMPKLMFGQEPRIIVLYKLLKNVINNYSEDAEKLIYYFRNLYKDKYKVIIPESIDEYEQILFQIQNKN